MIRRTGFVSERVIEPRGEVVHRKRGKWSRIVNVKLRVKHQIVGWEVESSLGRSLWDQRKTKK